MHTVMHCICGEKSWYLCSNNIDNKHTYPTLPLIDNHLHFNTTKRTSDYEVKLRSTEHHEIHKPAFGSGTFKEKICQQWKLLQRTHRWSHFIFEWLARQCINLKPKILRWRNCVHWWGWSECTREWGNNLSSNQKHNSIFKIKFDSAHHVSAV